MLWGGGVAVGVRVVVAVVAGVAVVVGVLVRVLVVVGVVVGVGVVVEEEAPGALARPPPPAPRTPCRLDSRTFLLSGAPKVLQKNGATLVK